MMSSLKYEGVSWNVEAFRNKISEGMTEDEFVEQGMKEGQYALYSLDEMEQLLKEAWRLINEFIQS